MGPRNWGAHSRPKPQNPRTIKRATLATKPRLSSCAPLRVHPRLVDKAGVQGSGPSNRLWLRRALHGFRRRNAKIVRKDEKPKRRTVVFGNAAQNLEKPKNPKSSQKFRKVSKNPKTRKVTEKPKSRKVEKFREVPKSDKNTERSKSRKNPKSLEKCQETAKSKS